MAYSILKEFKKNLLVSAGKEIIEFSGIMPNPTYAKVQEGAKLVRERKVESLALVILRKILSANDCYIIMVNYGTPLYNFINNAPV